MIEARGLIKRFGTITALDGIDLDVAGGSIYALLGPNGAGKTTTINILTTLAQPSGGSARVAGCDVRRRRIAELIELVQIQDAIDRLVKTYSGGMKRRLELARGLMTDPQVLFLDEPTQGLDPQNRVAIWDYIRALRRERGLTLLLTTHYMEEAEALADTVGIIDHGRKVAEGTPPGLVAELGADLIRIAGYGDA